MAMRPDYLAFFRRWARGLDRTELARAVAAAGLGGEWAISDVRRWSVEAAIEGAEQRPPRELSSLWNDCGVQRLVWADAACMLGNPRPTGTVELLHLLQEAAESAFMEWPEPLATVTWELPVRVAVLGDDRVSRELANMVQQHQHTDLVRHDDADVLIVIDSLRSAAVRILGGAARTPDLIVVLGPLGDASQAWSLGLGLSGTAAGLAVLDTPNDPLRIVHALIDEFTHDLPLDVALHEAARRCGIRLTSWLSAELIRRAHPPASLDRLMRRLHGNPTRRMSAAALPEPMSGFMNEAPEVSARDVADVVSRVVRDGAYSAETANAEAATGIRRWLGAVAPEMAAVGEPMDESTPRSVQTRWMHEHGDRHEETGMALEPGRPYVLEVYIGPDGEGWTASDVPFPVDEIDPERRGTTVTIAYARVPGPDEPPASDDAQRTDAIDVYLRPSGLSEIASFHFVPLPGRRRFFARITVLHRNRVIQTTLVSANVAPASEERPLEPAARHQVVDGVGNLSRNRSFDAAIVFNDGDGDDAHPAMYVYAGKTVTVHDITGLAAANQALGAELKEYTVPKYGNKGISKPRLTELLRRLSLHGRLLWEPLAERFGAALGSEPRIQVVATSDEELVPVELAYRRFAPTPEAKLCEHWKKALGEGRCTSQCKSEGMAQRDAICPLGFLGMSAIIERHATTGGTTSTVRPSVDLSNGALVALSTRVDKDHEAAAAKPSDELEQAVARVAKSVQRATDMTSWEASIARAEPPISWFVLLPHVEGTPPQMEIGDVDHPFQSANLEDWHLSREAEPRRPLVLLVGCNTALDPIPFHSLMNRFLKKSASAVVATLSKVRGPEASAGVRRFVEQLRHHATAAGPVSLGEVLGRVKRELLAASDPLALTLVTFGDVDVTMVTEPT